MIKTLNNIPKDKWAHAFVSACLAAFFKVGFRLYFDEITAALLAFGCALIVGLAKEAWDKISGKGTPELKDIYADLAGALIGSL